MPILNYTTSISFEKTIGEITKCLVEHGATKVVADYKDQIPVSITFGLNMKGSFIAFCLPANADGVYSAMKKSGRIPKKLCTMEQAQRVAWRIVKDWVEAQMAIVQAQLADMTEVFLPYAITKNGNTVYKDIQSNGMLMLGQ